MLRRHPMTRQIIKITRKEAAPFLAETFPNYTGRKFKICLENSITFYDTNWGGGTRNSYTALKLEGSISRKITVPAPWVNPIEGQTIDIPEGVIIVEHSIACGQDCGITIHARPDQIKWLCQ